MERDNVVEQLLVGYPVVIEQNVVWGEMDAYQHVNNVVYFRYFENARLEFCERIGWSEIEDATGVGPILAATQARFRKALTFPDRISIGTKAAEVEADRFLVNHIIVSHGQQAIVTEGEGTVVSYDYREKRKAPLPEGVLRGIAALQPGVVPGQP